MISTRCHYALLAVLELARREGHGLATISEIAKARRIPERFLEAILLQLKQSGITQSVRGKAGGYVLARPATEITVTEVIRIFDHDAIKLAPVPPGKRARYAHSVDVFESLWKQAERGLTAILDAADFYELAALEARVESHQTLDFVI